MQEQDKSAGVGSVKAVRADTPEERQWKQLQAYRQQQQLTALRDQKAQNDGSQDQLSIGGASPNQQYKHSPRKSKRYACICERLIVMIIC